MHYIIIPHRNRNEHLKWCLWSIERSSRATGIEDYFITVVDANSDVEPEVPVPGQLLRDRAHGRMFNKSRLLNIGIELGRMRHVRSPDDVFTFLDADAIVGRRWLEGVRCLEAPAITMLFYRVKLLPDEHFKKMLQYPDCPEPMLTGWFTKWERYGISAEFYDTIDVAHKRKKPRPPPFGPHVLGNSQLSIRADVLGDFVRGIRFDVRYEGRSCEDQAFIRTVWREHRDHYLGAMLTDPDFGMFHVHDPKPMVEGNDWNCPVASARNQELYRNS